MLCLWIPFVFLGIGVLELVVFVSLCLFYDWVLGKPPFYQQDGK